MPYVCPAGILTVGYGHVILDGETFDRPLSPAESDDLLARDLPRYELAVCRLIEVPLSGSVSRRAGVVHVQPRRGRVGGLDPAPLGQRRPAGRRRAAVRPLGLRDRTEVAGACPPARG